MSDVRFYDFDFNLLYILPAFSADTGYISVNTKQELNNSGAFEMLFADNELKSIIEKNIDNLIVTWEDFQGFLTSYRWNNQLRVTGMHLNGLLHRAVMPKTKAELKGDVETLVRSAITNNIPWLELEDVIGFEKEVKYSLDKYQKADEYIQNILKLDNAGYQIKADIKNKKFLFHFIKPKENTLMLSESNLNAYDFDVTYINKELSYGGWYEKEQEKDEDGNRPDPIWTYITLDDTKSNIYKIDTVLSSKTETEALNELKSLKSKYEITAKTKNIKYLKDYEIGDVLRVQNNGITSKKIISGISKWNEKSYGEEPILTEVDINE